jgi:2-polyprenyl-3-methyl-5-hydroxy-6-metoxy-1,4-benzoquinol methylase
MALSKNWEAEPRKLAERDAALSGDEAADLRRLITELQGSLSWKITAPLRFISKPLFRAMSPKTVPQTEIGLRQTVEPVTHGPMRPPGGEMTKADTTDNPTSPTLGAACNWYGIHPKFAHAVLETFAGVDYDRNIDDIHKLLDRYEPLRIQLEYAFSTNGRGRTLIHLLNSWGASLEQDGQNPRTYLDIGCAYGGFMIAFANHGYDAAGIELSGELYGRLGKLNLEASGCPANIWIGDFLSDDIVTGERKYDLITCNDVIEHVSDPAACLHKICRLLKPGGVAYVASPNKLSIPNVRADVHFQCFGLTLLDYFRARAAYAMYSGSPNYEVSDFYEPEWYVNTARSAGAEAEIVYDDSAIASGAPTAIAELYASFSEWAKAGSQKLDPLMRHEITRELAKYSARMFKEYSEHIAHNSIGQFARKWIDPLTRILIRKPSA